MELPNIPPVEATSPDDGVNVSFTVSAIDIVDGSVGVSCSSPSGFRFGDTAVSCFALDAAENTGTKSFTVTVTCPPGQHLDPIDGSCVPDAPPASIQPPVTSGLPECEEGEELVDGECVPESEETLAP